MFRLRSHNKLFRCQFWKDEVIELYWALNEHASALQADQHVTRRKCKFVALCGKVLAGVIKCCACTWKSTARGHQVQTAPVWAPFNYLRRSTTIVYRTDRQALSTARFCRTGQLATSDTVLGSGLVVVLQVVSALLRGNWQDSNWHNASRGPSAVSFWQNFQKLTAVVPGTTEYIH